MKPISAPAEWDVLVVGAGMAGLTAAAELQRLGRRVLVLDKGRGVGGRLATRRIGAAVFDHGAQFVTARTPRFQAMLAHLAAAGVAAEWCRGFAASADGHPRWRGHPGMTAIARTLAAGLAVRLEKPIATLAASGSGWQAGTMEGERFTARAVLLTPPVPQSLALLDAGGFALAADVRANLAAIEYERCLAVLAVLAAPANIPAPGARQFTAGPIAWLADNQQKGISPVPAVTIHASPAYSLANWDNDRLESGRELLRAAAPWLGAAVTEFQVHGWRFSKPLYGAAAACLVASVAPPLAFAGDAFAGAKVEGAALSGWAAAEQLAGLLGA